MATWYEAKDYAYNGEFVVPVEVVKVTPQMVTVNRELGWPTFSA